MNHLYYFDKFFGIKRLRNLKKTRDVNDGTRSINESILYPEVILAFEDFKSNHVKNCVLIGGVALSYYVKPRTTQDIDFLFLSFEDIPPVLNKFKRHRKGAFEHKKTQVEVEVVTSSTINIPQHIAVSIFETANIIEGIKVASPAGLVASKIFRFNLRDQSDIKDLIDFTEIDLSPFNLSEIELDRFELIKNIKY